MVGTTSKHVASAYRGNRAKVLALILGQQVRQHEHDFGPLVIRPKSQPKSSSPASSNDAEFVDLPDKEVTGPFP